MATSANAGGQGVIARMGRSGQPGEGQSLSVEHGSARWYALCTNANHEKRVADQLEIREVQHFLPTYSSMRRWSDRRVMLQLPLFPGYVFVRIALRDRLPVLQVPGAVRLVGFNGIPCAIPQEDIDAIQSCLAQSLYLEPHPYLHVGRRARVRNGPLQGLEGIILRKKNRTRFVLSFKVMMRAVAVEMDGMELELINFGS